jgi:hypothetical protein
MLSGFLGIVVTASKKSGHFEGLSATSGLANGCASLNRQERQGRHVKMI